MKPSGPSGTRVVLLTGASGFLGKVTLFELIRRREELDLAGVVAVVRGRGSRTGADRFRSEVASSPAFASLPEEWTRFVRVLDGDLASPGFGTRPADRELLAAVTHVVHCAAAVSFTLPGPVAAKANITTSLNLLEATKACPMLERIVYVSTAYVTPHRDGKIDEALVPLPESTDTLLAMLQNESITDAETLARTGHPNTYTFTKTIAEHMMAERRGAVPLSIVRPSIITASRQQPVPGWIDSTTGFGAFVTLIGLGHLRAVVGHPEARLDLIPVDDVASATIDEMISTAPGLSVRHAVAGKDRAPTVHEAWSEIERHFRLNPVQRRPVRRYLGPRNSAFVVADTLHHRVPLALANMGSKVQRRQAKKLASRLAYLNEVFPYFTSRTFDFAVRTSYDTSPFDAQAFVQNVCRGVSMHMLGQREDEWTMAGSSYIRQASDLRWVTRQPAGNGFVRTGIYLSSKVLRRTVDAVTVDIPSFERARDMRPEGTSLALVPTHRSFLDFILCSYLAFARPDLGIRVPHVAAAIEFGRLPLIGYLLRSVHAFYIERGAAKENRHLADRVHKLLDAGETLEFFPEGARSRSRAFLAPKRGLLRCIESSGRPCVLLPVAISYDRIPEEGVFARELAGAPKAGLRVGPFFSWLRDVWRGRVQLGRVHIACGAPVIMDEHTDAKRAGEAIMRELRGAMAVTSFHIDAYVAGHPEAGVDAAEVRANVAASGGRVLESRLTVPATMSKEISATMREHFAQYVTRAPAQHDRSDEPTDATPNVVSAA